VTAAQSLHLLVGAYAVNAVNPAEREQFEQHLDHCGDCRDELVGLREAAGRLAELSATYPPPRLRTRVLGVIGNARPLPPVTAPRASLAGLPPAPVRRSRAFHTALLTLAATVAVIACATAASWIWGTGGAPQTKAELIQHAPDAKHSLVESDAGWSVTVWHSDSLRQAVLVTQHMPAPPKGMVYQIWLDQPSSGSVSAGLMSTDDEDQSIVLGGNAASAIGVRITLEPVGGSDRPTSAPIAVFDFGRAAPG